MIYFPQTKGYISKEYPLVVGAAVTAEGQAMVGLTAAGVFGVKPSTGVASEVFVGIAVSQQITITSLPKIEDVVVPAGLVVTLARTPSAGTSSVWDKTSGAVVVAGGAGWTLVGNVQTMAAGFLGHTLQFSYRYAPNANESRSIQGDIVPGGPAGVLVNQIGIIKNGVVWTTEFDTLVNWDATNPVVALGANGQFTIGGVGTVVNCTIVNVPSASSPYLGLDLNY
jgi:hypothetical protein